MRNAKWMRIGEGSKKGTRIEARGRVGYVIHSFFSVTNGGGHVVHPSMVPVYVLVHPRLG
jgi:hypothetical protein